jgi:hypothetical protein
MTTFRKTMLAGLCAATLGACVSAAADPSSNPSYGSGHGTPPWQRATLADKVRAGVPNSFGDIKVPLGMGWIRATPCVSGPQSGAMGVHIASLERLGDGVLDPYKPEALIYEPLGNGYYQLVGVEFIVFAAKWAEANPGGPAPRVDGHLMNYVGAPNRYGLDPFYEIHVWAWENNPLGTFADFNTRVTCEKAGPADNN